MTTGILKEVLIINRRTLKALEPQGMENGSPVIQSEPTKKEQQIWYLVKTKGGTRIMHKQTNKVLDLALGGTQNGTGIHIWEEAETPTQLWQLTGGSSRKIMNLAGKKVLDIAALSEQNGGFAQLWEDIGGKNQRWQLVPLEENTHSVQKKTPAAIKPHRRSAAAEEKNLA